MGTSALLPPHPEVAPRHPLGCHRCRVPDRVVFEHVVAALVSAEANRHDAPLLAPTLAGLNALEPLPVGITAHLDRGYDRGVTRTLLAGLALTGEIARKGVPAPLQVGKRWVVERTQSWMNGDGNLRIRQRCRSNRVWWRRPQTPASCQSPNRRQQVTPEPHPISWGNSSHGMPERGTKRIPVRPTWPSASVKTSSIVPWDIITDRLLAPPRGPCSKQR